MFTINAEVRKEQGKGASRRLRAANKFPAIIYGGKESAAGYRAGSRQSHEHAS
ncbi:hypothetical protein OHC98_26880 [Escherichia coli]|nr:hypothetical protein [Escherichia coli]